MEPPEQLNGGIQMTKYSFILTFRVCFNNGLVATPEVIITSNSEDPLYSAITAAKDAIAEQLAKTRPDLEITTVSLINSLRTQN